MPGNHWDMPVEQDQHCWHLTGYQFLTANPIHVARCCWCGARRKVQIKETPWGKHPRHGPHENDGPFDDPPPKPARPDGGQ